MQAEAFIAAHLEEAGVAKTGTIGSKALIGRHCL